MTEKRKLAAVMFTDIAGYTALMSKDEQKALSILEKNRTLQKSLAEKHSGEFLKEMGDGTLLCFQSALDAVRCAMEIQESVKNDPDLNLRIGIHLGDIVFRDGDVFGDGVNVASRIEKLAFIGGICLSEEIYRCVRNQPDIVSEYIGEKHLKNLADPIKIYSLGEKLNDKSSPDQFSATGASKNSIAVLPFVNMSPDPENAYFADGLAEELINALAQLPDLHVAARTSAFQFRDKDIDIREIGRKLNVRTILEGSVRKAGNKLRIVAQLINIDDGYHLWSQRYDRDLEEIFIIQDDITRAIIDQLEVELMPERGQQLVKIYTENLEAYTLYLKGRFYWNSLTSEGWGKSMECYQKAIEIDPEYPLAYVGQSIWYQSLAFWADAPPSEALTTATEMAVKALRLDDAISDAHNCLGVIHAAYNLDWPTAEKAFKRALELDQNNALGHLNYAICATMYELFDLAQKHAEKARGLDPLSSMINTWAAMIQMYAGNTDTALKKQKENTSLFPHFWQPFLWLSFTYIGLAEYDRALPMAEKAVELSGGASFAKAILVCVCLLCGNESEAEKVLKELLKKSNESYVPPTFLVWIYIVKNEIDTAYSWFEKAAELNDLWFLWYRIGPEVLRADDARFEKLLSKLGLIL